MIFNKTKLIDRLVVPWKIGTGHVVSRRVLEIGRGCAAIHHSFLFPHGCVISIFLSWRDSAIRRTRRVRRWTSRGHRMPGRMNDPSRLGPMLGRSPGFGMRELAHRRLGRQRRILDSSRHPPDHLSRFNGNQLWFGFGLVLRRIATWGHSWLDHSLRLCILLRRGRHWQGQ